LGVKGQNTTLQQFHYVHNIFIFLTIQSILPFVRAMLKNDRKATINSLKKCQWLLIDEMLL